jgi:hypothetical protein
VSMPRARAAESVSQPSLPDARVLHSAMGRHVAVCLWAVQESFTVNHCTRTCTSMHPFLLVCILHNLLTRRAVLLLLQL